MFGFDTETPVIFCQLCVPLVYRIFVFYSPIRSLCLLELFYFFLFDRKVLEAKKLHFLLIIHMIFRCVIRGCVPKKILVYGAQFRGEFEV